MLQYVHVALSHQTTNMPNRHMFCTESVKCYSSLSLRCMWSCNWRMMRFLVPFFFLPSSTCFFSTSPTSHYLIGRFQVGFMRAKLISVSKFREQERGRKKRKTWLNGLFWFPLWCQAHNNEIKSLITFELLVFFFFFKPTLNVTFSPGILFGTITGPGIKRVLALFKNFFLCNSWEGFAGEKQCACF